MVDDWPTRRIRKPPSFADRIAHLLGEAGAYYAERPTAKRERVVARLEEARHWADRDAEERSGQLRRQEEETVARLEEAAARSQEPDPEPDERLAL